jgi:hypothetical protein
MANGSYQSFFIDAKKGSEANFSLACQKKGLETTQATRQQDVNEHWDWKVSNPKTKKISLVDVKGARKKSRSDARLDYNITWLEFKNVRGDNGSLLGKADYIAFEQKSYFLICKRKDLVSWVESKIIDKNFVQYSREAMYRYYQRYGRKDVITMVLINDIKKDLDCWQLPF